MTKAENAYFTWLYDLMCAQRFAAGISYKKLFRSLFNRHFIYRIPNDRNRASDGIALRRRFEYDYTGDASKDIYPGKPCSILEMMVALAIRCEKDIMDDPHKGDRTRQWFWHMIVSLGLNGMNDDCYDESVVDDILHKFLWRQYKKTGEGGLFTIKNCTQDLRDAEIWIQMLWYLDSIAAV
ncbi:hypothetical protein BRYFOR_08561 [Marvinbryantia formatexigens DSM 14469]|uniref:Uncharacterized protein n=1 Tax=Marvinbryantia formatexigens DSM 14469 TaxID=478749 RepID=C6LIT1_9FIRM|nr:hypothetical protein [Marvinbryantia formatexigens]EET59470.1 hypothetical protein BRYFOR_08561 [Marvinbryantia formatexigens DSM 14469]UWO24052.1 hypothetical protein NQ534_16640 [Marvinbryantia formatexigens DSM 14469]SDG65249.1 hypothetical protein SAMN05660368_02994 [Marvinbryantia formatexigens]